METENFNNYGDLGHVWYGKEIQRKTVEYILEEYVEENLGRSSLKLLDVGTGNGALLFKLAKRGLYQ